MDPFAWFRRRPRPAPQPQEPTRLLCWGCGLSVPAVVLDWRTTKYPLCPPCRRDIEKQREGKK